MFIMQVGVQPSFVVRFHEDHDGLRPLEGFLKYLSSEGVPHEELRLVLRRWRRRRYACPALLEAFNCYVSP